MIYGLDFLGLGSKHWPVADSLALFPRGFALGCFDTTFDDVIPNLTQFLDSGKPKLVRSHIGWDPDHTKKKNSLIPLLQLQARLPVYEAIAIKYPAIKIFISHSCEYSAPNEREVQARVDLIKRFAPHCIPVNACMKGPITADGTRQEIHGKGAFGFKGDLVSLDGDDCLRIDGKGWLKQNRRADVAFLWTSTFNMHKFGAKFKDPRTRTDGPTRDELRRVIALTK